MKRVFAFHLFALFSLLTTSFAANAAADRVYRNGTVFTADGYGSIAQAVAIRDGRIVYVGGSEGVVPLIGTSTKFTDLDGRFVMPGLVDGHMHPLEAGLKLEKCSLNYELLSGFRSSGSGSKLVLTRSEEPDGWLEVVSWFQDSMRPAGVKTSRATLDTLKTSRPIIVRSSFGHTMLVNSQALALANITKATPEPIDGKIWRDEDGTLVLRLRLIPSRSRNQLPNRTSLLQRPRSRR
jgi:predicted amidohydrolase YtcJ